MLSRFPSNMFIEEHQEGVNMPEVWWTNKHRVIAFLTSILSYFSNKIEISLHAYFGTFMLLIGNFLWNINKDRSIQYKNSVQLQCMIQQHQFNFHLRVLSHHILNHNIFLQTCKSSLSIINRLRNLSIISRILNLSIILKIHNLRLNTTFRTRTCNHNILLKRITLSRSLFQ